MSLLGESLRFLIKAFIVCFDSKLILDINDTERNDSLPG